MQHTTVEGSREAAKGAHLTAPALSTMEKNIVVVNETLI